MGAAGREGNASWFRGMGRGRVVVGGVDVQFERDADADDADGREGKDETEEEGGWTDEDVEDVVQ